MLSAYCERTGRKTSSVVRQLAIEWLEGDRHLDAPALDHPSGRRTNIQVSHTVKEALDDRIWAEGHGTVSALIEALLSPFLAHRATRRKDAITVRVKVSADRYDAFAIFCGQRGWSVSDGLSRLVHDPEAIERLANVAIEKETV